jgi:hypothetical protein
MNGHLHLLRLFTKFESLIDHSQLFEDLTPLMAALITNQTKIARHLVLVMNEFEQVSPTYGSSLHMSIRSNDIQTAITLCQKAPELLKT